MVLTGNFSYIISWVGNPVHSVSCCSFFPAGGSFDVAGLVGAKYRHCAKFVEFEQMRQGVIFPPRLILPSNDRI